MDRKYRERKISRGGQGRMRRWSGQEVKGKEDKSRRTGKDEKVELTRSTGKGKSGRTGMDENVEWTGRTRIWRGGKRRWRQTERTRKG